VGLARSTGKRRDLFPFESMHRCPEPDAESFFELLLLPGLYKDSRVSPLQEIPALFLLTKS